MSTAILTSIVAFIVAIGVLVTVHEFGHFWVARRLGFKVLRFSIGFGKPLVKRVSRDADAVEYVLAAIPLGGYVRLLDERDGPVPPEDAHRAFNRRPPLARIAVLLAGTGREPCVRDPRVLDPADAGHPRPQAGDRRRHRGIPLRRSADLRPLDEITARRGRGDADAPGRGARDPRGRRRRRHTCPLEVRGEGGGIAPPRRSACPRASAAR